MPETHTDNPLLKVGSEFAGLGRRGPISPGPMQRERLPEPLPAVPDRFERYETITFTLAAVATVQEAGQFSGRPDSIDLFASAANVDVFLTDELGREESSIRLPALDWVHTEVSKRRVRVQDSTGVGTQVVRAVGKWASRGD